MRSRLTGLFSKHLSKQASLRLHKIISYSAPVLIVSVLLFSPFYYDQNQRYFKLTHCENINDDDDKIIVNFEEFITVLKAKLKIARDRLKELSIETPDILVYINNGKHAIQLQFDTNCDITELLKTLAPIINKSPEDTSKFELINGVSKVYSNDMRSSIHWYRNDKDKTVVVLTKRKGYTHKDIDLIVFGYEQALLSSAERSISDKKATNTPTFDSIFAALFQDVPPYRSNNAQQPYIDNYRNNSFIPFDPFVPFDFSHQPPLYPPRRPGSYDDDEDFEDGGDQHYPQDTNQVIKQLEGLGAKVVYDTHNNPSRKLSWDDLAGYDHIKQTIEDVVINSYLYPDVYDSVARQTRANFESNRPTAILLEGSPGTGKAYSMSHTT